MAFQELLQRPVSSLKPDREPLTLAEDESPVHGFQMLADNNIRACPIVSKDSNEFIGTLDLRDVCKFFVEMQKEDTSVGGVSDKSPKISPRSPNISGGNLWGRVGSNPGLGASRSLDPVIIEDQVLNDLEAFTLAAEEAPKSGPASSPARTSSSPARTKKALTSEVLAKIEGHPVLKASDHGLGYLAKMRPFQVFAPDAKISEILGPLCHGSHLVGVSGVSGNSAGLSAVITQGMLFHYFAEALQNCPIKCSDIMSSPVTTVLNTCKAIEAFGMMASKGHSGLAVIDEEDGSILQNTSLRDLKMWVRRVSSPESQPQMHTDNIEGFLVSLRKTSSAAKTKFPVSICHPEDSVGHVVKMLLSTHYHRVWVTKSVSERQPIGVISLTDILSKVVAKA